MRLRARALTRWCAAMAVAIPSALSCRGVRTAPPPDSTKARARTPTEAFAPNATSPLGAPLSDGPMRTSVLRGLAILASTRDSLPQNALSALRCMSCHLDSGTRRNGIPLTGVYARFPQYRARSGQVDMLQDRINDCFLRSLNGRAIAPTSSAMHDIVAYMAWVSRGIDVGDSVPGQGLRKLQPLKPDTAHGRTLYASTCIQCHGPNGEGTQIAPPLWGGQSFNIGAGMARLYTAASFIRYNMPYSAPGSLSDQDAFDVAGFVLSHPRPDFPGKENDWPNGDPPPDVAYQTKAAALKRPATSH